MQQPLANRVASDADPTQIAAAVLAIWEEIDDALTPIVGPLKAWSRSIAAPCTWLRRSIRGWPVAMKACSRTPTRRC